MSTTTPLREATALPGTRIRHLTSGWLATIVSCEWPSIWVHFDIDQERDRPGPRKVWGRIFGVVMPGDEET